ncbi:unnamed protein product [Pleuronectes platessa]|uniref:Uncharacterized protein n=1 Tax=Pleuronectes platessa TaxID=8262 RepID=A0A9N7VSE2_PLEPL|nr:unnamed protein product [Pleuronectes platessa]
MIFLQSPREKPPTPRVPTSQPPGPPSKFPRNPSGLCRDEQIMFAAPRGESGPASSLDGRLEKRKRVAEGDLHWLVMKDGGMQNGRLLTPTGGPGGRGGPAVSIHPAELLLTGMHEGNTAVLLTYNNAGRAGCRRNNSEVKSWARPSRDTTSTEDPMGFMVQQLTLWWGSCRVSSQNAPPTGRRNVWVTQYLLQRIML